MGPDTEHLGCEQANYRKEKFRFGDGNPTENVKKLAVQTVASGEAAKK
jgi:hypothetical protein